MTDARGQVRKYFYDVAGRITDYVGVEDSVSYTYDANGHILMARVSSYTDTFENTIRYTYDAVGNLERMTYPDNTVVTYIYDENNNLTNVMDWEARLTTYTYDALGRISEESHLANNTKMCYTYDNLSRVTKRTTVNLSFNFLQRTGCRI